MRFASFSFLIAGSACFLEIWRSSVSILRVMSEFSGIALNTSSVLSAITSPFSSPLLLLFFSFSSPFLLLSQKCNNLGPSASEKNTMISNILYHISLDLTSGKSIKLSINGTFTYRHGTVLALIPDIEIQWRTGE